MHGRVLKTLLHIGIVLLAAGIISGGTSLLVGSGALSTRAIAGLPAGDAGRQFTRTLVNPPVLPAGGGLAAESFGQRGFGRGAPLAVGLAGMIHNLVLIAAVTVGVLVVRKLLGAGIQILHQKSSRSSR